MMPFAATWMDIEIIKLYKVSQRKTKIMWYHLYSLKSDTNDLIYTIEIDSQAENELVVTKGEMGSG